MGAGRRYCPEPQSEGVLYNNSCCSVYLQSADEQQLISGQKEAPQCQICWVERQLLCIQSLGFFRTKLQSGNLPVLQTFDQLIQNLRKRQLLVLHCWLNPNILVIVPTLILGLLVINLLSACKWQVYTSMQNQLSLSQVEQETSRTTFSLWIGLFQRISLEKEYHEGWSFTKEWNRLLGLHIFGLKQERVCPAVCCCTCSWCQLPFSPRDTQVDRVKLSTMHQGEQPQCLFFLQLPFVSIPSRDSQNILDQEVFPLENAILFEIKQELIQMSMTVFGLEKVKTLHFDSTVSISEILTSIS